MSTRTRLLLLVLFVSVVVLLVKIFDPLDKYHDRQLLVPAPAPVIPQKERDIFQAVAKAEAISDPVERCKAIPMPQGINWPSATIEAFCADVTTPSISWGEVKGAIESGNGKALDARFDRLIANYFSGSIPEGAMRSAYYYNFDSSTALSLRLNEQWLAQSPNSAHALAASGLVHIAAARDYRGSRFIADTSKFQIDEMSKEVALAIEALKKAIDLNPRIMPAYQALIEGARLIGDAGLASRYMDKARAIDPNNYYVFFEYAEILEPRWGGSMEALKNVIEEATKLQPANPRMVNLIASAKAYPAYAAADRKDESEQYRILSEAVAVGPHSYTMERFAWLCANRGEHMKAYEMYTQVLRKHPENIDARYRRASEAVSLLAYESAKKDISFIKLFSPKHKDALKLDAYVDLLTNKYLSAEKKLGVLIGSDPIDEWSIEQVAWIAIFRTQNIALAREMIDRGFAIAPQKGSFHWLNWELVRRTDRKNLKEITQDFVAHADRSDERQVEALRYTKEP